MQQNLYQAVLIIHVPVRFRNFSFSDSQWFGNDLALLMVVVIIFLFCDVLYFEVINWCPSFLFLFFYGLFS